MPVLRTVRTYRCRSGKRFIRLYRSWYNIRSRVDGRTLSGCGQPIWRGLEVEWQTFEEFRAWALGAGYSKRLCSLDRIDSARGYTADNCRWLTVHQNSMRAFNPDYFDMGGVPLYGADCPF